LSDISTESHCDTWSDDRLINFVTADRQVNPININFCIIQSFQELLLYAI